MLLPPLLLLLPPLLSPVRRGAGVGGEWRPRAHLLVQADIERSSLILETGVNQRWRYGGWRPSPDSIDEAQQWEEAKGELQ